MEVGPGITSAANLEGTLKPGGIAPFMSFFLKIPGHRPNVPGKACFESVDRAVEGGRQVAEDLTGGPVAERFQLART